MKKIDGKLIIKGHEKNILVKFWNWGWSIYYTNPEIWNYLIVGLLTTLVSIGVKFGLLFTIFNAHHPMELQLAVIASWIAAVTFAYIANRVFVFKSKSKKYMREIIAFVGGRILTLLMEMFVMWFFITLLKLNTDAWVLIVTVFCQVLITVANYVLSKLFVFTKK